MSRKTFEPLVSNSKLQGSPLAAIRSALDHFSERKDLSSTDGCMGINAICEFGMRDENVTRITRRAANAQRHTLAGAEKLNHFYDHSQCCDDHRHDREKWIPKVRHRNGNASWDVAAGRWNEPILTLFSGKLHVWRLK